MLEVRFLINFTLNYRDMFQICKKYVTFRVDISFEGYKQDLQNKVVPIE